MRSAIFGEPGEINIIESPEPVLKDGWVVVSVGSVGICGTDLHMLHGRMGAKRGLRPGHELSGIVQSKCANTEFKLGDKVAIEPSHACGNCDYCKSGLPNHCEQLAIFGVTRDGGLSELIVVPEKSLYQVDQSLSFETIALCEPLAVCLRGTRLAEVKPGSKVVILGGGAIGLMSIITAQHYGANEIHVIAKYPHQRELAASLGATRVYENAELAVNQLGSRYIDNAIETVGGNARTLNDSIRLTKPGGTVAILGAFSGETPISAFLLMVKELRLVGSSCYAHEEPQGDFALASSLLPTYQQSISKLVTHRFPLTSAKEAFNTAYDKSQKSIKVQIQP